METQYGIREGRIFVLTDNPEEQIQIYPDYGNGDYLNFLKWVEAGNRPVDLTPKLTLAETKAKVREEIKVFAASIRNQIIGTVSPGETAAWVQKEQEAWRYQETSDAVMAPSLAQEAQIRGVTLDKLVELVLHNAMQLRQLEALIAGTRGRHDDAIAQLETVEDVEAYDWRSGWNIGG